jgi:hypothetical protein
MGLSAKGSEIVVTSGKKRSFNFDEVRRSKRVKCVSGRMGRVEEGGLGRNVMWLNFCCLFVNNLNMFVHTIQCKKCPFLAESH